MNTTALITDPTWIFFVVLGIILFAPLLLRQLRVPPVVGLILAGILVGQYGFNLLAHDSSFELFGQVGIYYIMFLAGLELEMGSVEHYGRDGLRFGILTFTIPFLLGIASSVWLLGFSISTSLLLACIYASHTLVTYPIVGRYGLARHRAVVVSVVATAIALFVALLVLAVVVGGQNPDTSWTTWLLFGLKCVLYVAFAILVFPRVSRWFLRRYEDGVMQFIFILALVFLSASLAKIVGLEGLLGAFLAGLIVNRLIPKTSPLMSRLEFVGNALFIPYFLIGVGMIIDISILVRHPEALWLIAVMVVTGTLSKLIASAIMSWTMGEGRHSMWLMFGLTNAHAAGALAIVTIGTAPNVQLMNDEVLGSTVMLILFSCIISGFATSKGAKQLALSDTSLEDNRGSYHGKCLITYSQEANVDVMTQLAILIRNPFIPDSLMGLFVSYEDPSNPSLKGQALGHRLLEQAQMIAAAADVPMATLNRMSTNISGGILHTMNEYDCGEVIVCLTDRTTGMAKSSLGSVIDNVVNGTHREVMAVRSIVPPGTIRRVVVAVPQKAEYEVGFYKWLEHICRIGEELDCHLEYHAHADTLPYIKGYMEQKHSHVRSHYAEMNHWMQFLNLRDDMGLGCMLVAVIARRGFISYQDKFEEMPLLIHRYFSHTSVMLLYPDQWGEPQESISVFTPNGTAVQRQPRSIGGWLRRKLFMARRTALLLLLLFLPFHFPTSSSFYPFTSSLSHLFTCSPLMAQRPRFEKMSPMVRLKTLSNSSLREKTNDGLPSKSSPLGGGVRECLLSLVQCSNEEVLRQHGCRIYAQWGNIYAAAVPKQELATLSLRPEVMRVECGRVCDALTDTSAVITRSDLLRTATPSRSAYTGKGVVVGVVDIGFDLTNPTFYSRDLDTYRIRSFWDMLDFDEVKSEAYGMELPVGKSYDTKDDLLYKACSSDSHLQYHGSHTASTAAGSGYDSPYIGMAPDADICLVSNAVSSDKELVPDSLWSFFGPVADLLGFEYIFRYADKVGKPCVINFSEGTHEDLWGEAQLFSTVLDSLVRPGRIICASAGNQSLSGTYMQKPHGKERSAALISVAGNTTYMMLRSRGDFNIQLDFMSPYSKETYLNYEMPIENILATEDSLIVDTITAGELTYELIFGSYPCCYDDSQLVTDVVINKIGKGIIVSVQMALGVTGREAEVEVFQQIGTLQNSTYYLGYSDAESTHNVHFPGSDPSVICVGATSYRKNFLNCDGLWQKRDYGNAGEVATFSSRGPTLAGLIKPDVLAPGSNIVAGFNSFYAEENPDDMAEYDVGRFTFNGRNYSWSCQGGTSMSCPIVAGIIAQWMEAIPTLTREQIIEVFEATCRRHDSSLTYPNNDYGYGEIDAEAGLNYLLGHYDGIDDIGQSPAPSETGRAVYNLLGQRMGSLQKGINIINGKKILK